MSNEQKVNFSKNNKRMYENYPDILRPEEVQQILDCSRSKLWEIMYSQGFPLIKWSRTLRIPKTPLIKWLEETAWR